AGNLCESGDVFTRDTSGNPITRKLDRTCVGDLIALCEAGAYGFSMASHYNARLLPPEVLIRDGRMNLIRERQSFDDLIRGME
ncbi:MAG TPA: diaminopimelate decarboxylase, partial [Thermoanaerobaculia bacterium]